jgi:hypothetical protein
MGGRRIRRNDRGLAERSTSDADCPGGDCWNHLFEMRKDGEFKPDQNVLLERQLQDEHITELRASVSKLGNESH